MALFDLLLTSKPGEMGLEGVCDAVREIDAGFPSKIGKARYVHPAVAPAAERLMAAGDLER